MDNKNLNVNTLTCSLAPVALGCDVSEAAAPLKCLTGNFTYITSKLEANLGALNTMSLLLSAAWTIQTNYWTTL